MTEKYGPKYERFSGIYTIIVNPIKLYTFFNLMCGNELLKHGMENVKLFSWIDSPQWARASSLSRIHDHTNTPHSGLLWTSDQPDPEISN
jgi:hypothetical protein